MRRSLISKVGIVVVGLSILVGCSSKGGAKDNAQKNKKRATVELLGAGATFPFPLYSKMFSVYNSNYGTKVNYQSIGSGGGVRQITAKTVDFGASDKFITDEKLKGIEGELVHIPTCLGAVVVSYNIPSNPQIKLTPSLISDIFLGKITSWDDSRIAKVNSGVTLPKTDIIVVHRSDGSGTTAIFTDYLSKVSSTWKSEVGSGKSVKWPVGIGAKGNEGVAGNIKTLPGAIGYCELAYAKRNGMPQAQIQNLRGKFITPSLTTISAAAQGEIPDDTRITLTNTDSEDGYPIAGFTWLLIYKEQNYGSRSLAQSKELINLVKWMLTDGQKYAEPLDYAPLSSGAAQKALAQLSTIGYNGEMLLK